MAIRWKFWQKQAPTLEEAIEVVVAETPPMPIVWIVDSYDQVVEIWRLYSDLRYKAALKVQEHPDTFINWRIAKRVMWDRIGQLVPQIREVSEDMITLHVPSLVDQVCIYECKDANGKTRKFDYDMLTTDDKGGWDVRYVKDDNERVQPFAIKRVRETMGRAFAHDPEFLRTYVANVAMLIHDACTRDTERVDPQVVADCNHLATEILKLLFEENDEEETDDNAIGEIPVCEAPAEELSGEARAAADDEAPGTTG